MNTKGMVPINDDMKNRASIFIDWLLTHAIGTTDFVNRSQEIINAAVKVKIEIYQLEDIFEISLQDNEENGLVIKVCRSHGTSAWISAYFDVPIDHADWDLKSVNISSSEDIISLYHQIRRFFELGRQCSGCFHSFESSFEKQKIDAQTAS